MVWKTGDDSGTSGIRRPFASGSASAPVEPILVEAIRGDVVEARHRAHAVALAARRERRLGRKRGARSTHFRSSAKPIQALPLLRARPNLDDTEIAIACASHLARPEQLDAVRRLLAKAPAGDDDLETGPEPTRPLEHDCSGKHAGILRALSAVE